MVRADEIRARTRGHCPNPKHDDKRPSLSVSERNGKILVHCHAGCSQEDVLRALRAKGMPVSRGGRDVTKQDDDDKWSRIDAAKRLWARSVPIKGTLAERYIRKRRLIDVGFSDDAIRFLPFAHGGWRQPAMIVALRNERNKITAVQLTYLDRKTGKKARLRIDRQTFGVMAHSAAKLTLLGGGDVLGLAEGVETALSAAELYDLPVWAVLGAQRLVKVDIPDAIKRIRIFADNDTPGITAGRLAGHYYRARGYKVTISRPTSVNDYNDLLRSDKTHDQ